MSKKRSNGEGSIYKRLNPDGTFKHWEASVSIGRDNKTGIVKRKTFTGKTQKAVKDKMYAYKKQLNENPNYCSALLSREVPILKVWSTKYMEILLSSGKKPSTLSSYHANLHYNILPILGNLKVDEVTYADVEQLYVYLMSESRKCPKTGGALPPLSAKTIKNIHWLLVNMLDRALKYGYISENPIASLKTPTAKPKKIIVLTEEQVNQFFEVTPDHRYGIVYQTVLYTGLRRAEVIGLRWNEIDFEKSIITVTTSVRRDKDFSESATTKTKVYLDNGVKTGNSKRIIPMHPDLKKKLLDHREKQIRYKEFIGELYQDQSFVFTSEVGTPIEASTLSRVLKRLLIQARLPDVGIHSLRHTFATICVKKGMDLRTLAEIMGHHDMSFLLKQYVHTNEKQMKAEIQKLTFFDQDDEEDEKNDELNFH